MSVILLDQAWQFSDGSYVRSVVAGFAQVGELDVGFYEDGGLVVAYARADREALVGWDEFARAAFPSVVHPLFFTVPRGADPLVAGSAARRVSSAARGTGRRTDEAAFALGGAQAVADLVLGEQRERQPAQRVLPA